MTDEVNVFNLTNERVNEGGRFVGIMIEEDFFSFFLMAFETDFVVLLLVFRGGLSAVPLLQF